MLANEQQDPCIFGGIQQHWAVMLIVLPCARRSVSRAGSRATLTERRTRLLMI